MIRFFSRAGAMARIDPEFKDERRRQSPSRRRSDEQDERATALPEVSEGNTEADWALWEQSVQELDREVSERRRERNAEPKEMDWDKWLDRN